MTLRNAAFRTVDVAAVMAFAAANGLFVQSAGGVIGDDETACGKKPSETNGGSLREVSASSAAKVGEKSIFSAASGQTAPPSSGASISVRPALSAPKHRTP